MKNKKFELASFKSDDATGTIEAIVSVFGNVDRGRERIRPGFFAKSLANKLPKGVWMHDWKQPIAKTLEGRELAPGDPLLPEKLKLLGGLYIKGIINLETQRGKEAYSDIKFGIVDEFSIGYNCDKYEYSESENSVDLIEGEIYEWSPVLVGMNDATHLISIKGDQGEFETDEIDSLLAGLTYDDHFQKVLDAVEGLGKRSKAIKELREKSGKKYSNNNKSRLALVISQLKALLDETPGETEPEVKSEAAPVEEDAPAVEDKTEANEAAKELDSAFLGLIKIQAEQALKKLKTVS